MQSQSKYIYTVENLSKKFQSDSIATVALTNVSFRVKEGEFVVIVGPSGCGKSTLLKLLANLLKPTSGKIIFKDSGFGFVFQEPALMPWRTVIDNIILPLEIRGKEIKRKMYQKAATLLKILNLSRFAKYYPAELSGGISQRTAIARALITDPLVLLMDEPFSALDEILRLRLNFELLQLKRKTKKTIVFVTHNILEAVILADKIIIMGLNPNTVMDKIPIKFEERTPKLLTNPRFFKTVEKIRKIIDKAEKRK